MKDLVAFTTIRQGSPSVLIEKIRSEIFLNTAKALSVLKVPCVAIFTECDESYLSQLRELGVVTVPQSESGMMGRVRREALRVAMSQFPSASYYCWMEPEKSGMPEFLEAMVRLMETRGAVLGLFNRINMDSYPEEQAYYYLFCRAVASKLVGFDLDYGFGPMMISREGTSYFLEYDGGYGDQWEAILVPRIRAIRQKAPIVILPVDFRNDPRMTAVESGNPSIIMKRVEQFNNVIPSLLTEWQR